MPSSPLSLLSSPEALFGMQRLAREASECVRGGISRDAAAHLQLTCVLIDKGNIRKAPTAVPAPAQVRFHLERTPFPSRPTSPLVSDGLAAHFSSVPRPLEIGTPLDLGDLAITTAVCRHNVALVVSNVRSIM